MDSQSIRTYPLRPDTSTRRQPRGNVAEEDGFLVDEMDQRSVQAQWGRYKGKRADDATATQAIEGYLTRIENQLFDLPAPQGARRAW
jgi:hypothetical protein